jgi:hypothetical protein
MDYSWMSANRVSEEYKKGVKEFILFAFEKLPEIMEGFIVIVLNVSTEAHSISS